MLLTTYTPYRSCPCGARRGAITAIVHHNPELRQWKVPQFHGVSVSIVE